MLGLEIWHFYHQNVSKVATSESLIYMALYVFCIEEQQKKGLLILFKIGATQSNIIDTDIVEKFTKKVVAVEEIVLKKW